MKRYYKDMCGNTASIDDNNVLKIRDYRGKLIINKKYNTVIGAKISLGKYSDGEMKEQIK